MGVPQAIINFIFGFSMKQAIQLLGWGILMT